MFKKMFIAAALCGACLSVPAFAWQQHEVADIEVVPDAVCDGSLDNCKAIWRYTVFSLEDGLIVKGVTVNNGRCIPLTHRFGRSLREDDYAEFTVATDTSYFRCQPDKVELRTNKGDYEFNLKGY